MKNTIINGDGTSRTLKAPSDMPSTYSEWRTQMINGTAKADISLDPDGCSQVGTALNKENLLADATATALGLTPATATPNDAISALNNDLTNKADLSVIAPPYDPNKQYKRYELCSNGGKNYRCKIQCLGIEPPNTTYWQEMSVGECFFDSAFYGQYYNGRDSIFQALISLILAQMTSFTGSQDLDDLPIGLSLLSGNEPHTHAPFSGDNNLTVWSTGGANATFCTQFCWATVGSSATNTQTMFKIAMRRKSTNVDGQWLSEPQWSAWRYFTPTNS